jgi:hypothetical protein
MKLELLLNGEPSFMLTRNAIMFSTRLMSEQMPDEGQLAAGSSSLDPRRHRPSESLSPSVALRS